MHGVAKADELPSVLEDEVWVDPGLTRVCLRQLITTRRMLHTCEAQIQGTSNFIIRTVAQLLGIENPSWSRLLSLEGRIRQERGLECESPEWPVGTGHWETSRPCTEPCREVVATSSTHILRKQETTNASMARFCGKV
jgi:hypothetical protein